MMRAAPWPKPIGEADEVPLVDCVENLDDRPLDDLVFQSSDPQGPLTPIRLRDEHATRGLCAVRSSVHSFVKILELLLHLPGVVLPRLAVDPRRRIPTQSQKCSPEAFERHVMEKRREPRAPVSLCDLSYAVQRTGHAFHPALCPERVLLDPVPLGQTPSLHPLRGRRSGVVRGLPRYYGPVRLPTSVHHRIVTLVFPMRPAPPTCGQPWDLPVSVQEASTHAEGLRPRGAQGKLAMALPLVLPSLSLNKVGTPEF